MRNMLGRREQLVACICGCVVCVSLLSFGQDQDVAAPESATSKSEQSLDQPPALRDKVNQTDSADPITSANKDDQDDAPAKTDDGDREPTPDKPKPAWVETAERILEIGAEEFKTEEQRTAAYKKLTELRPPRGSDVGLQYAFALVAIKEKKWEQTQVLLNEMLEQDARYVLARAALIRVYIYASKSPQAIVEMERLAEHLRRNKDTSPSEHQEHAARFLGLVVGYFEGPSKISVKPTAFAAVTAAADKLPDNLKLIYEESRQSVKEQHRVLSEEGEEAYRKLKENLEKEADDLRKELEAQKERLKEESENARKEIEEDWNRLNKDWQKAWQNTQNLFQNWTQLAQQRNLLQTQIAAIPRPRIDQQGRVDPDDNQRYQASLQNIQFALSNVNQQIFNVENLYAQARIQGVQIERQLNALQVQSRRLGMSLQAQRESFSRIDADIRAKEQQAATVEPKKTQAQLRRERAFATYDDFNYHKEAKLLLGE